MEGEVIEEDEQEFDVYEEDHVDPSCLGLQRSTKWQTVLKSTKTPMI